MQEGQASFDEIAFVGDPGSQNNKFFIRTGLINPWNLIAWIGQAYYDSVEAWFIVDFWNCVEGEEFVNNMCIECDTG